MFLVITKSPATACADTRVLCAVVQNVVLKKSLKLKYQVCHEQVLITDLGSATGSSASLILMLGVSRSSGCLGLGSLPTTTVVAVKIT